MPDEIYEKYCRNRPRKDETRTWATEEIGRRFRHGRQQAGLTQRAVAGRAGVNQSEISRFERGMTPHMSAYKVLEIGLALGPRFPFGYCPHDHRCKYARPSAQHEPDDWADSDGAAAADTALANLIEPSADAAAGISSVPFGQADSTIDIGIDIDMLRIPDRALRRAP